METDFRNEKLGYKIREAQTEKIPYMLIIGNEEVKSMTVTPRKREKGENLKPMAVEGFITHINQECQQQMKVA